jgi:glycosyltransferase involved in cell wall biosynthesis
LFKAFSLIDDKLSSKVVLYLSNVDYDFNSVYKFKHIEIQSLGKIPYNSVVYLYKNIDILLFPSYIETLGLPLIEAASLGLPVLASDLPFAKEVLDGYEGVSYIDCRNAEAWGDEILKRSFNQKMKHPPYHIHTKKSWDELFRIIKQRI